MKRLMKSLTFWVIVGAIAGWLGALILGTSEGMRLAGETHPFYGTILLLKGAFIRSLFMLVAPVVFFSLIDGVISIGSRARMQRLGGVTVAYYLATTAIAIGIGLVAVFCFHPWTQQAAGGALSTVTEGGGTSPLTTFTTVTPSKLVEPTSGAPTVILKQFLLKTLQNPFSALAENNILAIVLHALLIGLAILMVVPAESPLVTVLQHTNRVFHKILSLVILLSPIGVFAIVFDFTFSLSGDLFRQLFQFCGLVFAATMIHGLIVLPGIAWLFAGVTPFRLFRSIAQPLLVALSTASSAATLPVTIKTCEDELGVSGSVASFVCPLGATMNMDGTALFEGIAAVFLAHLFGVELHAAGILAIFAMAMVSSIGAPGMPSGSMSGMQMVLLAAGIPLEAIGILLVVERPLDTFRTAVNVEGDIVGALVVDAGLRRVATTPRQSE
ncbi:MAG: dicarboxylate/amino acid:cation symporter [Verrucomicrobia bacterium]|nr:dicarboxylate/amino acid:cation symporter [Verrucomicrobiota bacterium]